METPGRDVVPLDAHRDKRRHDEIDALNFGTRHRPGSLEDLDEKQRRADASSVEEIERMAEDRFPERTPGAGDEEGDGQ